MPVIEKNCSKLLKETDTVVSGANAAEKAESLAESGVVGEGDLQSLPELWDVIRKSVGSNLAVIRARRNHIESQRVP